MAVICSNFMFQVGTLLVLVTVVCRTPRVRKLPVSLNWHIGRTCLCRTLDRQLSVSIAEICSEADVAAVVSKWTGVPVEKAWGMWSSGLGRQKHCPVHLRETLHRDA